MGNNAKNSYKQIKKVTNIWFINASLERIAWYCYTTYITEHDIAV